MDPFVIAGLTNPEAEYRGTRHNIGADVVRALANKLGITFRSHRTPNQVATGWTRPGGTPLILGIGNGYMNRQGNPIGQLIKWANVPAERLIVVHDELDLPVGVLKTKRGGTGGHNGLKSVHRHIGHDQYIRLRFGIGRPPGRMDPAKYVLSRFSTKERESIVDVAVQEAVDALIDIAEGPYEFAQQRLHSS